MEVIELKELYENSVRSFTTLMLQMVQNHYEYKKSKFLYECTLLVPTCQRSREPNAK